MRAVLISILAVGLAAWAWCGAPLPAAAQEAAAATEAPEHEELRAVRAAAEQAIAGGDVEALLAVLHPDVVVTWPSEDVSRGREGVRTFYEQLLEGPDAQLEAYSTTIEVDDLAVLHGGDTAVAWGAANDLYTLADGTELKMRTRWTATVVKQDGDWLVAAFAGTNNPFDNAVLTAAKQLVAHVGLAALVLGGIVGFLLGRRGKKD